jgi:hypothetical protein
MYTGSKNDPSICHFYFSLPYATLCIISLVIVKDQTILRRTASACNFSLEIGQRTIAKQKHVFLGTQSIG